MPALCHASCVHAHAPAISMRACPFNLFPPIHPLVQLGLSLDEGTSLSESMLDDPALQVRNVAAAHVCIYTCSGGARVQRGMECAAERKRRERCVMMRDA